MTSPCNRPSPGKKHNRCASSNWLAASMPKSLLIMSIALRDTVHPQWVNLMRTKDSPTARSNSLSLKFAIMQHLLKGFQRRRRNVISGLLFVLSSFSINSGSPCKPSTEMIRSPADTADSGWMSSSNIATDDTTCPSRI